MLRRHVGLAPSCRPTWTLSLPLRHLAVGGRKSPTGARGPLGKAPRVKQTIQEGIPRRVPGTTKLTYTNKKGRTFAFSIPVTEITHPPVHLESPSSTGWKHLDTSYCDTGELDEDLPSEVDEVLRRLSTPSDGGGETVRVRVSTGELQKLQRAFIELCRSYVLMDTDGMKASMTYSELNVGPDYEMYDRKTARKRHWLAIRHRFEEIRTLLFPTTPSPDVALSAEEMLECLVWAEAASTFCFRKFHPYEFVDASEFTPLDMRREVQFLADFVREHTSGKGGDWFSTASLDSRRRDSASLERADDDGIAERQLTDRYISCASLCLNHKVKFSDFFDAELSADQSAQRLVTSVPVIHSVKDAIRVMTLLDSYKSPTVYKFSNEEGALTDTKRLECYAALCSPTLFAEQDCLRNVDEVELCALMQFVVEVFVQNARFFDTTAHNHNAAPPAHASEKEALLQVRQRAVARCRFLLYKLGGPQTTVMSGDDESVPFADMQDFSEQSHPDVKVHFKIGMENAPGLRFAFMSAKSSAVLVEQLDRLALAGGLQGISQLMADLVQHMAHKTAMSKAKLDVADVVRVLPLLRKLMDTSSEQQVKKKYEKLFSAIGGAIGVHLQQSHSAEEIVLLLEGLALCRYIPSCFQQLELVLLRGTLSNLYTPAQLLRALRALVQLVGPKGVTPALLQSAATLARDAIERREVRTGEALQHYEREGFVAAIDLLHMLRYCRYTALGPLLCELQPFIESTLDSLADVHLDCLLAPLFAYAAVTMEEGEMPQGAAADLLPLARKLMAHVAASKGDETFTKDDDLMTDTILTCAALELEAPHFLSAFAESGSLHSLISPLMAAHVMASLEALHLERSNLYSKHEQYLMDAVSLLETEPTQPQQGILPDDAAMLMSLIRLHRLSRDVTLRAGRLLLREIERLDDMLQHSGKRNNHSESINSFESALLKHKERIAEVENTIFLYYSVLMQNDVTKTMVESPSEQQKVSHYSHI